MKEKEIVRSLKKVAKEKPEVDRDIRNHVIENVLSRELPLQCRGGNVEFLLSQISFVNKRVWFLQGVWMVFFLYVLWNGNLFQVSNEGLCILSMAPPLLLLLTVEDVSRIYHRSMLEIEYATKYSLKKVVLTRLLILSTINGSLLLVGMLFAGERMELVLWEVLVYGLTPLFLMTFLLLKMMEKLRAEQLVYGGISLYFAFLLIVVVGGMEQFNIYGSHSFGIWMLLFVCGLFATIYQGRKLAQHLENFEGLSA